MFVFGVAWIDAVLHKRANSKHRINAHKISDDMINLKVRRKYF
jgi:hypothetical protein